MNIEVDSSINDVRIIRVYNEHLNYKGERVDIIKTPFVAVTHPLTEDQYFHISKLPEHIQTYLDEHVQCVVDDSSIHALLECLGVSCPGGITNTSTNTPTDGDTK